MQQTSETRRVTTRDRDTDATSIRPVPAADADPADRPGVPMEAPVDGQGEPPPPVRQVAPAGRLRRAGLDRLTPVFGTAQPPRGASGLLRRAAYAVPEHRAGHWMLLMGADRVDVLEHRAGEAISRPLEALGLSGVARSVRRQPALCVLGAVAAAVAAGRALGARRAP